MPWLWSQKTGRMYRDGELFGIGYAGRYSGLNNHEMQDVKETGPLPVGIYHIGDAYSHEHLGPITMNLTPSAANEMFGRADFRIHGDYIGDVGKLASKGCVVLSHGYRAAIADAAARGERLLEVVADYKAEQPETL